MKHRPYYLGFVVVLLISLVNGCYYDNMEELYPLPEPDTTAVDTVVTFSGDIQPFIKSTCATNSGCHAAGSFNPVLETYDQISGNADRIKARAITEKSMPPAGNTQPTSQQLEDFQTWLDDNKPDN